jgi:chemotaxis protein histidine kinase CheA
MACFATIVPVACLLAWVATVPSAAADTIHLQAVPPSPARESNWTVTATGEASSTKEHVDVLRLPYPSTGECPAQAYPKPTPAPPWEEPSTGGSPTATVPEYTAAFEFHTAAGDSRTEQVICGYLTLIEGSELFPKETTMASTTLRVTVLPSAKELQAAQEARERQAAEQAQHRHAEEVASAAQQAKQEALAALRRRAEEAANAEQRAQEEALAQEAREKAEHQAAIAAARARAHKTPVTHLSVKAVPYTRASSFDPGYTSLRVNTSPYAYVVVKLARYGHTTLHFEWGGRSSVVAEVIRWSCKSPGGTYHYVVTAKSGVGRTLTRRGHFAPVSSGRCHQLKRQEREARERNEREAAEEQSRAEREERERLTIAERNCEAEGGRPITLIVEGRAERYCKAPNGGILWVPY